MDAHDVVRARRFELIDDAGRTRALLTATGATDLIGIHIANDEGRPVVSIGVDPELDVPFITLRDKAGSAASVFMTVTPDGEPAITVRDRDGEEHVITA